MNRPADPRAEAAHAAAGPPQGGGRPHGGQRTTRSGERGGFNSTRPLLVYRREQLLQAFGVSASTLKRWIEREGFPRPIRLGARAVGWNAAQCHAWLAARPLAGAGDNKSRGSA